METADTATYETILSDNCCLLSALKMIPKNCFKVESLAIGSITNHRAKSLFTTGIDKTAKLFVPTNPDIYHKLLSDKIIDEVRLEENIIDLYLFSETNVSQDCASIISTSISNDRIKTLIEKLIDVLPMSRSRLIKIERLQFGKQRFSVSRKLSKDLYLGQPIPNRKYSYRVHPERIATSIQRLMELLSVVAGMTWNEKIDGHIFRNTPVYSRGGKSLMALFYDYRRLNPNKKLSIGCDNFFKIGFLLCKKGEIRTGLSSYYIKLRDIGEVLASMLDRIANLEGVVGLVSRGSHDIKQNVNTMLGLWHDLEQFLAYDCRTNHIRIQSDCAAYCCTHALSPATNSCTHQNTKGNCVACHQGELFIEALHEFIHHLSEQIPPEDNDMRNEIETMSKVSSIICGQI